MKARREVLREVTTLQDLPGALRWAEEMARAGLGKGPVAIRLSRPTRSLDANRFFWTVLRDISQQVDWHGQKLTEEEWKDAFSAALRRQKVIPGIEGGFVVLGTSTSRMTTKEFSDLTELALAFGTERGVIWTDPKRTTD